MVNSCVFGTVSVATVTPMHPDGSVDYDSYGRLVSDLIADGCDSILVNGTTGESATTTDAEKAQLIRVAVEAAAGKAVVFAGAGSNNTAHAVSMAQDAEEAGAQGLLVVSPYYNRPSQEGLYQHCLAVTEAADLPVMLYDIPGRTGLAFGDETLDRLAQHERVVAVKDATGNPAVAERRATRTGLAYYSGDDGLNFTFLSHGAAGVVSVVGHVAASILRRLVDACADNDMRAAHAAHQDLLPYADVLMGGGQGAVMAKEALFQQGRIPSRQVRLPLVSASAAECDQVAALLG